MPKTALVSLCASLVAGAFVGCGEAASSAPPASSDKPATSVESPAPATSSEPASITPSAEPTAVAKDPAPTPAPAPADAGPETLKYMPKSCEQVRAFVNTGKLFGGDVAKALEALKGTMLSSMAGAADAGNAKKAGAELEAAGLSISALKEFAVCAGKGNKGLAAARLDFKGNLGETLAKAIGTASGKAPQTKDEDGWTFVTVDRNAFIATHGGLIIQGTNLDDVKAAAKGGGGAAEFGDAASYVVWLKGDDHGKTFHVTLKDAGADYALKISTPPMDGLDAVFKKDPKEGLKVMQTELDRVMKGLEATPFKMLAPALKNAKLAMEGQNILVTSVFPQALISDAANVVAKDPINTLKMFQ